MYSLLLLLLLSRCHAESVIRYECGEHGRFEYCIDGTPGCVIGCYCHPGYYFDTETKICEHNSKLTQIDRRHLYNEPIPYTTLASTTEMYFLPTTAKSLEANGEVTQEGSGDLSDWLYNQFFKTIENQVLNNTEDETLHTRRSGSGKRRRLRKKRKKSASERKRNLRRKILRITADDSLFDDNDSSSSDYSDDSSSSSSGSSELYERSSLRPPNYKSHKKIIMIQKKPKPALPSFIFLPNADTPFYPPIGLPPPPPLPMYPMVPIPPMFITGNNNSFVTEGTKSQDAPTTASVMSKTTSEINIPAKSTTESSKESTTEPTTVPPALRHGINLNGETFQNPIQINKPSRGPKSKHDQRKKLKALSVNNLMNRLKYHENPARNPMASFNLSPLDDDYANDMMQNDFKIQSTEKNIQKGEDVDFKYLTDLIHKIDSNSPKNSPMLHFSPNDSIGMQESHLMAPPAVSMPQKKSSILNNTIKLANSVNTKPHRRSFNGHPNNELDDTFYTHLGRQIAALIREANTEDANQITIELDSNKDVNLNQAEFYDNRYAPRSYWERTVRSTYASPFAIKFGYLAKNNKNLYDLENKVKLVASTPPSYNLQQLENIINTIETSRQRMRYQDTKRKVENVKRNEFINKIKVVNAKYPTLRDTLQKFIGNHKAKLNYNVTPNFYQGVYNYPITISKSKLIPSTEIPITHKSTTSLLTYNNRKFIPQLADIFKNKKVYRGTSKLKIYPAGAKPIYESVVKSTSKPFSQFYPYNTVVLNEKPKLSNLNMNDNTFLLLDEFDSFPERTRDKPNVYHDTRRYYFDT